MSSNIDVARSSANSIIGALGGSSSAMRTLGNTGSGSKPEVMLAVALAHA